MRNGSPEFWGMIFFNHMGHFMDNNIINNLERGEDYFPMKIESVCYCTGSPTEFKIQDPDYINLLRKPGLILGNPFSDYLLRMNLVPVYEDIFPFPGTFPVHFKFSPK